MSVGPITPASKKPAKSESNMFRGRSQCHLDSPLPDIRLEEGAVEDEELTNLDWLLDSKNLLNCFGVSTLRSVSPVQEHNDTPPSPAHWDRPSSASENIICKPPCSFSCLIFMAIEDSPTKRLLVRDIYNWILEHFPYFANAPAGWKNSVRHNLSLNKCFKKVDTEKSQRIGKGSFWCIDPAYRQNLIRALKKTPYYQPLTSQTYQSISGPSIFFKRNGALLQQPDIDAANAMILLNTPLEMRAHFSPGVTENRGHVLNWGLFPGVLPSPSSPTGTTAAMKKCITRRSRVRTKNKPPCGSQGFSRKPKEDHNYSRTRSSNVSGTSPASDSIRSSAPSFSSSPGPAPTTSSATTTIATATVVATYSSNDLERSFQSRESHYSKTEEDSKKPSQKEAKDALRDNGYSSQNKKRQHFSKARKVPSHGLPVKTSSTKKLPASDDDKEIKDAAWSLLHLAGIWSSLNNITNPDGKGTKRAKGNHKKLKTSH